MACTVSLSQFEMARVVIGEMPVSLAEIGVLGAFFLWWWMRTPVIPMPRWVVWGVVGIVMGVGSSFLWNFFFNTSCVLSAQEWMRGLGILKSWFVFPMICGWIVWQLSNAKISLETKLIALMVSLLPIAMISLLGWFFGSGMTYDGRLRGWFASPNMLSMMVTPAAILSWAFFRRYVWRCDDRRNRIFMWASWVFVCVFGGVLFLTKSYSAWMATMGALLVFEGIVFARGASSKKYLVLFVLSSVVILGLSIALLWNTPRFEHFFERDSRSSFASRVMIWHSAGAMIADAPIVGIGPGNFQACYLAYQQFFLPYLEWSVPEPHNIFLAFWLGGGLLGLLAFLFVLMRWFHLMSVSIMRSKDVKNVKDSADVEMHMALVAIMVAIVIHGLFDTTYWRSALAFVFWIVFFLGIESVKKYEKKEK